MYSEREIEERTALESYEFRHNVKVIIQLAAIFCLLRVLQINTNTTVLPIPGLDSALSYVMNALNGFLSAHIFTS